MAGTIRIMGLDPGLNNMGWGIVDLSGVRLTHVANGTLHTKPVDGLGTRLLKLHTELTRLIHEWHPDAMAVEQAFVAKDPTAALKLGHARAVALLAAAQSGLDIAEYSPNHIKKSVVGVGHADKAQVQAMVKRLLPACDFTSPDAADALAAAITHSAGVGTGAKIKEALR